MPPSPIRLSCAEPTRPNRSIAVQIRRALLLVAAAMATSPASAQPAEASDPTVASDRSGPTPSDDAGESDASAAEAAPAAPPPAEATQPSISPAPVAEPTPTAPAPAPTRLGPFGIETPNGEVTFGFAAQVRVSTMNDGPRFGDDGDRTTETFVELRRVRLFLRGNFLDDRLAFLLQLSTSPASLEVVDLSLDGRLTDDLSLRVGQFKTPFTMHRFRSFQNLSMTEWDVAAGRFGSERQIGLELHSQMPRERHLDYALGVFTGVNARSAFARGVPETYAEPLPNPSNLRSAQPPTEIHPEIIGRIGYASDDAEPLILSDARGGGLRGYAGLSAAYDFRPNETQDFAARIAAEGLLKFEHLMVNGVGYLGFDDSETHGIELGMIGATLDVAYRVLPRFEISARYSRVDTLLRFRRTARDYVDRIVAEADPADAADVANDHSAAGRTRYTEEYAIGINVPLVGRSLVIQSDLAILRTDRVGTADDTDAVRARTQLQFAF